ncbi:MAG: response regulator [Candidatus Eremiobacteraeota bacterium]|nr:response regulator [Candidatus Eremiobacteraeota bacterium]
MNAKILVVDDDPSMRDTVTVVLEDEGFDVIAAANGFEAIEKIKESSFDLLICDIRMAGMDGLETLAALRKSQPELRSIIMTGYASEEDPVRAIKLGVDDYLYKPFDAQEFLKSVRKSIETLHKGTPAGEEGRTRDELLATMKKIAFFLEERDPYYSGHSKRVATLSLQIFKKMGYPRERTLILETAALLHDLGQIEVKQSILHKKGNLSAEELATVQRHPQAAREILAVVPGLQEIVMILFHHHERYDGKGYPAALKGDDIPIESRIIAVAEAYDALISARPHRDPLSPAEALAEISRHGGTQFDPRVVEALTPLVEAEGLEERGEIDPADEEREREEELSRQKRRKTLINLAHTFRELGQHKIALQAYEESLQMEEDMADILSFEAADGIARLSLEMGELTRARGLAEKNISLAEKMGKLSKGSAFCTFGLVLGEEGRWAEAEEKFRGARETFELWEDHQKMTLADLYLAGIYSQNAGRSTEFRAKFATSLRSLISLVKHYNDYDTLLIERKRAFPLLINALMLEVEKEAVMELVVTLGQQTTKELESLVQSPVESNRVLLIEILEKVATGQAQALLRQMLDDPAAKVREQAQTALSNISGKPVIPVLRSYCLGKFRLASGDSLIKDEEWKTKKSKYVLAYLLSRWNEDVPEEKLLYAFWPDSPPKKSRQSLHTALYQIRQLFQQFVGDQKVNYILHEKEFYRFNTEAEHYIDLKEFEQFYKLGSRYLDEGKEEAGIAQLQKSEALYVGEFLEGYFSDWAIEYRENIRKMYIDVLVRLANHFFKVKKYEVSLDYSQKILTHDSCRQDIHMMVMKCYQALGQKELAIKQYQFCTQILKRELNISPSTELMALYLDLKG